MDETKFYINYLLSLTKSSLEEPYRIEWVPLYGTHKEVGYLANKYHLPGSEYKGVTVMEVGADLTEILSLLTPMIERYPYAWPLEGQKLDPLGYDFHTNEEQEWFEIEPIARQEVWRKLGLVAPTPSISIPYVQPETVSGGHLTKFSLTLGKASPISLLSFQMQSSLPVRLASLLYESDISGYSEAQKVDLDYLQVEQSAENITLLFGKAIFAKRLTFVLAQDNAKSNTYYANQNSEDFNFRPTDEDALVIERTISKMERVQPNKAIYQTENIYTDEEIKDWSSERKAAYLEWRNQKTNSLRK